MQSWASPNMPLKFAVVSTFSIWWQLGLDFMGIYFFVYTYRENIFFVYTYGILGEKEFDQKKKEKGVIGLIWGERVS